jgi:hypothetical protein
MDIDSFASADLDRVHFDEEPPGERGRQQYEESLGRLVDRAGDVRWTLTPLLGLNFVYHELTDSQGNPRRDGEAWVVVGDIDHNPHLSDRGRERFLKRFEKEPLKLQARKSGRWVHFAGLIYDEFDEHRHVCPDRDPPRAHDGARPLWPVFASIDPGIHKDHPAALVMGWLDAEDVLEVFHAHKIYGGTVADMAAHFHEVCAAVGIRRPQIAFIDPAARSKQHQTGRSTQDEYRDHGIHTVAGQNDVAAGINRVKERLRSDRLRFQARTGPLLEEIPEYRWRGQSRSRLEDASPAKPIKRKDDCLDALRYLVMGRPTKPQAKVEPEPARGPERSRLASLERLRRRRRGRIGGVV